LFYPNTPLFGPAPSNLAILSACLKQDGFDVKLFDCTIYKEKKEQTQDQLRAKLDQVKASNLEDFYPLEASRKFLNDLIYSDGTKMPMTVKPDIVPYTITGEMTNTPSTPHEDFQANALMSGQKKKGTARRGYYYENISEDSGSISAVVPNSYHLKRVR
jgi:hypothetical protein